MIHDEQTQGCELVAAGRSRRYSRQFGEEDVGEISASGGCAGGGGGGWVIMLTVALQLALGAVQARPAAPGANDRHSPGGQLKYDRMCSPPDCAYKSGHQCNPGVPSWTAYEIGRRMRYWP